MTTYSIPGIYNALDPVMGQPGMLKSNSGMQNAESLQATINTAIAAGGGIVLIPATDATYTTGPYKMGSTGGAAAITIPSTSPPLLIIGSSLGTMLSMQNNGDVFDIDGGGSVFFQDLTVEYNQTPTSPLTGQAFYFDGGEYYGLLRVSVINCQYPFVSNGSDQLYILECSASYTSGYPAGQALTVVSIVGAETFIEQCVFSFAGLPSSNQSGIVIGSSAMGSSYTRVVDTEIENFYTGIELQTAGGARTNKGSMFTNVRVLTPAGGTGLKILPNLYDARFIACDFGNETSGRAHNIVIGPVGSNESIDTVIFDACTSEASMDYGIEIEGGQNIQVLGGTYSGNTNAGIGITGACSEIQINGANCIGLSEPGTGNIGPQEYGIYINPGSGVVVKDVQLTGVNCSGTGTSGNGTGIYVSGTGASDIRMDGVICEGSVFGNASEQKYGVYVAGASGVVIAASTLTGSSGTGAYGIYLSGVMNVTVSACDLFGNASGGVSINGGSGTQSKYVFVRNCNITGYPSGAAVAFSGTLAGVEVTNCSGYNDAGTAVSTTAPATGHLFHAYDSPYSYYGPVVFYTSGGGLTQIAIDGQNTNLTSGSFTLGPGDSATLTYTGVSGPTFIMIGE